MQTQLRIPLISTGFSRLPLGVDTSIADSRHRFLRALAVVALVAVPALALAEPKLPTPTLAGVLASDMLTAKLVWSKVVRGTRVEIAVTSGTAARTNPVWTPGPQTLQYDLGKNRELVRAVKRANLSPAARRVSSKEGDRTLEIFVEGPRGPVRLGAWAMSKRQWQKQHGALVALVEPLFEMQADTFQLMGEKKSPADAQAQLIRDDD